MIGLFWSKCVFIFFYIIVLFLHFISVSVKLYKKTEWRNAVVKYATPKDEPLDLAVLSLDDPSASIGTIVPLKTTQAVEGMCIHIFYYGFLLKKSLIYQTSLKSDHNSKEYISR